MKTFLAELNVFYSSEFELVMKVFQNDILTYLHRFFDNIEGCY